MTTTIGTNGRFCNHFIRNIAVSMIARKYDLETTYSYEDEIKSMGITLYSGKNKYKISTHLTDISFLHYMNSQEPMEMNFIIRGHVYFQTRPISNLIHKYLKQPDVKESIIEANKFNSRYNNNNDIFIHIRLGDVANYNPGLVYYEKVLNMLFSKNPSNIYISSDSIEHITCRVLLTKYKNVIPIHYDFIDTLKFASTCKYVILSHGSFSATIGNLSYFSEVYYPRYDPRKMWYGDMFSGNGWNEISYPFN